ncbi:MAG: Dabb family protein [Anaerolineales bacterium]|nr:Dabb family protein [Anaerolineales bacterium]
MITHIVFFKLLDASSENQTVIAEKLLSMQGQIPQLRYLEVGIDKLRTARSFDLSLITRFDTWEDYEGYQNHPYHQTEILPYVRSVIEKSVVVDYESVV